MATTLTCEPPPDRKHAVSLMRIGPAQCRFIISEPANKPIFCGAPTNGCSWCAWHRGIVYRNKFFSGGCPLNLHRRRPVCGLAELMRRLEVEQTDTRN